MRFAPLLFCLVIFHAPDGTELRVDTQHIAAIRPIGEPIREHVVAGTKALLYVNGQKLGIIETDQQAEQMIESCQ